MAGQPSVFDWAVTIPIEGPAGIAQVPPYAVITSGNTLSLRAYFHCGGRDRVQRANVAAALAAAATTTVTFFLQNLQIGGATPIGPVVGALIPMAPALVQAEFEGAGDLVGSGLDPTDQYYRTGIIAVPYVAPAAGTSSTSRILTVLRATGPAGMVTAFDDSLVVQIIA